MIRSVLTTGLVALACSLSQAAVTFNSISQNVDGVGTTTTLQDRTGSSGSTQTVSGTSITVNDPLPSASFSVALSAAAGEPTSGTASVELVFTVADESVSYTSEAESFIDLFTLDPMPASGTLEPGTYLMSTSLTGGPTTPTLGTLALTFSIPEPGTAALGLLGLAALLRRRR